MPVSIDERLWLTPSGEHQSRASDEAARSSMAALVGRVIGAKPFPETARRLAEMTRMPNARIGSAVRVLETDPGLSAGLLRLVNSPGYALRMRCTSLRHAAALVGLERLNHIATTAAVLDMFSDSSEVATGVLDHSTVVGAFCRYFAVTFSLPAEELFTCGFLHDIGKLLMLEAEGSSYAELLASAPEHDSHLKERERFGFDHATLGAHVLSAWNIPEPVPLVVAWHHDSGRVYEGPVEVSSMIDTLRLADAIAHAMGRVSDERTIHALAESEPALRLNLGRHELSRLWPDLKSLRDHCRAQRSNQSHFVDVTSIRPTPSLPPSRGPLSIFVSGPPEPTCSVCSNAAVGEVCSVCDARVCDDHKRVDDGWCDRCVTEYASARGALGVGLAIKLGLGAALVSLLLGAAFGAWQNGAPSALRLLIAPAVALLLSAAVLGLGQRWIVLRRFLKARKQPEPSEPAPPFEVPSEGRRTCGAVLTIPPSAYSRLPLSNGLPQEVLPEESLAALLGSSPAPPASGVRPSSTPVSAAGEVMAEARVSVPAPVAVDGTPALASMNRCSEPSAPLEREPSEARPARAGASRDALSFSAARSPRRGRQLGRTHRRRGP
jgi:putative nucleotidyltransferase with HDIG domain